MMFFSMKKFRGLSPLSKVGMKNTTDRYCVGVGRGYKYDSPCHRSVSPFFLLVFLFSLPTIPAVLAREEQVSQQREEAGMRVLNTKKAKIKILKVT
jgi:hypothetical protein